MKIRQKNWRARLALFALLAAGAALAGCGKKGDLTLPPDDTAQRQTQPSSQSSSDAAAHVG